jgi:type I restriction enzyme S subunit
MLPTLRFPEFEVNSEWVEENLGRMGKLIGGGTPSRKNTNHWIGNIPWISSSDISENDIHNITISQNINENAIAASAAKIIPKGSILFVSRVGVGKLAINNEDICTSQDFTNFIPTNVLNYFIAYYFLANNKILKGLSQGTSIRGFSKNDLEEIRLLYPKSPQEQQKIAACLTSLDDLITAHTQKLEALKDHKKGLLQNLFPQEGETVPRLRFPTFEGDGEWVDVNLIDTVNKKTKWSFTGGPFGSNLKASDYTATGIRIIQLQNIGDGEFHDDNKIYTSLEKADELLSCNIYAGDIIISKMGDPVGRACIIPNNLQRCIMASDGIRLVVDENKFSKFFIYSLLNSKRIRKTIEGKSTGSTRKRIGLDTLRETELIVPWELKEQQKIASCLFAIDEIISDQSAIIVQLQQHKKGLMQGLFPKI